MKDTIFYFGFDANEDKYITKAFIIQNLDTSNIIKQFVSVNDEKNSCWSNPHPIVNGIGNHTYITEDEQIDEIMEEYRQYFINRGATVSKIVELFGDGVILKNNYEIYQLVKEQL